MHGGETSQWEEEGQRLFARAPAPSDTVLHRERAFRVALLLNAAWVLLLPALVGGCYSLLLAR